MIAWHLHLDLCHTSSRYQTPVQVRLQGHDRVTIDLIGVSGNLRYDQIINLQDARYVSAFEAFWRLYRYGIVDRSPLVVGLDGHLEQRHTLYFGKNQERQEAAQARSDTKRSDWFKANKEHSNASHLRYVGFLQ